MNAMFFVFNDGHFPKLNVAAAAFALQAPGDAAELQIVIGWSSSAPLINLPRPAPGKDRAPGVYISACRVQLQRQENAAHVFQLCRDSAKCL